MSLKTAVHHPAISQVLFSSREFKIITLKSSSKLSFNSMMSSSSSLACCKGRQRVTRFINLAKYQKNGYTL